MIFDLDKADPSTITLRCDVAIVGAGIAGSLMAAELARAGLVIAVLESGGRTQESDGHPLNRVIQKGQPYLGAELGRFRCLGGTSTRWGGAMLPFLPEDMEATDPCRQWPVTFSELAPYLDRVEESFRLPQGDYREAPNSMRSGEVADGAADFAIRCAKWPAFRNRNVANLFNDVFTKAENLHVWLNATVTAIALGEAGTVTQLSARGYSGNTLKVFPKETVIAAGAIESTRLMLKLDADHGHQVFSHANVIGRYFHDHLSSCVADIEVGDRRAIARYAGFRFDGPGMRNLRFELSPLARRRHNLACGFAHISFVTTSATGFDGLRNIYRALQRRGSPAAADVLLVLRNAEWLARAAADRFFRKRLTVPRDANYELHLVTEQIPIASNRIRLSTSEADCLDVPLAEIDWRVSADDLRNSEATAALLARYWSNTALASAGTLRIREGTRWRESLASSGGIYHPGGSLRMSASRTTGVVDRDLLAFGINNLRVVSTAVFPTGGTANPTMTLALFALRAVDDLRRRLVTSPRR